MPLTLYKHHQTDAYDCVIQSVEIQLIGSHSKFSSNGNFIIYDTFNFVTEWLHNKEVMPYYRENEHLLRLPSKASISTSLSSNPISWVCVVLTQCHLSQQSS